MIKAKIADKKSSRIIPSPPGNSSNFFIGQGFKISKKRWKINPLKINIGSEKPITVIGKVQNSSATIHDGSFSPIIFAALSQIKNPKKTIIKQYAICNINDCDSINIAGIIPKRVPSVPGKICEFPKPNPVAIIKVIFFIKINLKAVWVFL